MRGVTQNRPIEAVVNRPIALVSASVISKNDPAGLALGLGTTLLQLFRLNTGSPFPPSEEQIQQFFKIRFNVIVWVCAQQ